MKHLNNLATLGVMSLPVWIVVVSLTRPELGNLTVRLAEAEVTVTVGDRTYHPDSLQLGPLALEPGTYKLRVLRGDHVLYAETLVLASGADRVVNAFWEPGERAALVHKPLREFTTGCTSIKSVGFSPAGRLALSAGNDRKIRIWDLQTGSELRGLEGHLLEVSQAVFSADGGRILSCSKDCSARLWDVAAGRELRSFSTTRQARAVAISTDGTLLLTAGDDQSLRCWEAQSGAERGSFLIEPMSVSSVALSRDGRQILAGYLGVPGERNPVCLLDAQSGHLVRRLVGHSMPVWSVALSADGRLALSGSSDRTARLWSLPDGRELRRFEAGEGVVLCVAFSPDSRLVLAGTGPRWKDGWEAAGRYRVRLWEARTGRLLRDYPHDEPVRSVAVAPDGRSFLSGGDDGVMRLWSLDPASGNEAIEPVTASPWEPSGRLIEPLPAQAIAKFSSHEIPSVEP